MSASARIPKLLAAAGILLLAAAGWYAWKNGWLTHVLGHKTAILGWCAENSFALYLAIVLLPGFGFPASPLLILAGVVWGNTWLGCALAASAVVANICWTHLLAGGPGRALIKHLMRDRLAGLERIAENGQWRLAVVLRVTPGVPLCLQNYALALIGLPLWRSLVVALPITGMYVCGFVLTGGAVFEGDVGEIILGVSFLIATAALVRILRQKFKEAPADKTRAQ